jgi:RNA polymerase sigma-70 factor (ECF subfamily)
VKDNTLHIGLGPISHLSDRDGIALRQGIAEGDEASFAQLFNHYYPLLRPFVLKFTDSSADTEEILQETFIRIWLSRDKVPGVENLQSWIFTIASRLCLSVLRGNLNNKKKITALQQQSAPWVTETPADNAHLAEITQLVAEAVNLMPPQRQRIYRLSREEGLKPAAVAGELLLSVHTVKNVLVVALKDIRSHLAAAGHIVSLLYILERFL